MKLEDTLRSYRLIAGFYDLVFGPIFENGRAAAVKLVNDRADQRILEVGVGTGLSLPLFRRDARVTGIDVSPEMLEKARARVKRLALPQVEAVREMDAEHLEFAADSFEAVLALYVVSVVSDPARFSAEIQRVCKPGGRIVIVNHFSSAGGPMRAVENAFVPLAARIGFHPDFPLDRFLAASGLTPVHRQPVNLFGYWTLLVCVNRK